jgi:uncharacterized membrane protein YfcA
LSWTVFAALTAVMAASALLQGAVGFGLGLIAIPFLIYLDLRFVPGPLLVAALTMHVLVLRRDRSGIDSSGLTALLGARLLGTIPAAILLASLPPESTSVLLAAVVLAGALMSLMHSGGPPHRIVLFIAGLVSGFMATVAALGGPPVALVYQRESGLRLRGTLAAYFIIGTVVSLLALTWAGRFTGEEIRMSLYLIPGTVIGFLMSRRAAEYLDTGYTRVAVLSVSMLAALSVIAAVLLGSGELFD